MRTTPPPGKKRVADWIGMRIKARVKMRNGYVTVPVGAKGTVRYALGGLSIDFDPCKHCGLGAYITRVESRDVEVLP